MADTADAGWRFTRAGHPEVHEVQVNGRLRTGNASLRLGAGVIVATLCREVIDQGRLVQLLPDYRPMPRRICVFMPARPLMPARVRAFLDALDSLVGEGEAAAQGPLRFE